MEALSGRFLLGSNFVGPLEYRWLLGVRLTTTGFGDGDIGKLDYYRAPIQRGQPRHSLVFDGEIQIRKLHRWDDVQKGDCLTAMKQFYQEGHIEKPHFLTGHLINLWEDWGNNDKNPGCFHQRSAGWSACPGHSDLLKEENCSNMDDRAPYDFDMGPRYTCQYDKTGIKCFTCGHPFGTENLYRPLPPQIVRDVERMLTDASLRTS